MGGTHRTEVQTGVEIGRTGVGWSGTAGTEVVYKEKVGRTDDIGCDWGRSGWD